MISKITTHKRIFAAAVLTLGVVLSALALALSNGTTNSTASETLPPMTLTYEVPGPSISVGNRSIPAFKELMRLEYRSQTDWTETVLESPVLDLGRYGAASNVGSYRMLKGNTYTEYDSSDGSTTVDIIEDGSVFMPVGAFGLSYQGLRPFGPDVAGTDVATDIRTCFRDDCDENAGGVKYVLPSGRAVVVLEAGDFVLPVDAGDIFSLRSADIQADR